MHELKRQIKQFIRERDWEQYHAPKNLAMALSVEVTEILEIFQWKDPAAELNAEEQQALREEIGDVMIYLIELADQFGIDPVEAAEHKLTLNEKKYPAEVVRGRADKYTEYRGPEESS
jgi:NTP pyrophosphatase (non-canonical NTP hydrolase)